MSVLFVTGTDTEVGKTVVTAAIATTARMSGRSVAVVKPAQSGVTAAEPGDLTVVTELSGVTEVHEFVRLAEPLAPGTAARRAGQPGLNISHAAQRINELDEQFDLVLVEGAGGLMVQLNAKGQTLVDLADELDATADVIIVTRAGLGTLNHTALTATFAEQLAGLSVRGIVIGAWPQSPELAECTNVHDLPRVADAPLLGALPADSGELTQEEFALVARRSLAPALFGTFDAADFLTKYDQRRNG